MGILRSDERVSHALHGAGVVIDADQRYTIVKFDDGGVRKFVTTLAQLQHSDLPLPAKPAAAPRRRARSRTLGLRPE